MAFLLHRHAAVAPRYKSVVMDFSKADPKDVHDSVKSKAGFEEDNHATLLSQCVNGTAAVASGCVRAIAPGAEQA